ncbi:MAG: hypothetical protein IJW45_05170 [Oscillospiraceae bacterium]|nr:hypothetical protein [Oscillospiraceae bacterium]
MEKFIDIHCHILHGVDDGAKGLEEAVELLKIAQEDGTGTVVLTPHYRGRFRQNTPQQLREALEALRQAAPEGMTLHLGNEVAYEKDVTEKLTEGRVLSLAGSRYVLLEFGVDTTGFQAMDAVLELIGGGFVPVIAHAERYPAFQRDKQLTEAVLAAGALIQINADSVMGKCGFGVKRFCHWLLKGRRAHFVASDAHDREDRPPKLGECFRYICKKYGEDYAAALFRENARVVLTEG